MLGRILGLISIPLTALALWGLIRQLRKEQVMKPSTPVVGLAMGPITLLVNLLFLRQAASGWLGPVVLILGLGFGLAWGQTTRLHARGNQVVARRSVLHLILWGISCAVTQLLASVTTAVWVAGGLAAMFFSTGSTLGTNLNLLVRQLRVRPKMVKAGPPTGPPR